jgi:multicomponent Na+:H+ antiporter subunit E
MDRQLSQQARSVLKKLRVDAQEATVACPLCGAVVPSRGLRVQQKETGDDWQLLFTCPSCGLVTAFSTAHLSMKQLEALQGSSWGREIRHYTHSDAAEVLLTEERANTSHLFAVFVISFLTWIVLTGSLNPLDVLWGGVVSFVVARFSYRFVRFNLPRWIFTPRRWLYFADLVLEFTRQIVLQNITLSIRVLRPDLPIKPGIVAIPTKLRDEVALTILGSLMTLTPDTVTLDIDQQRGIIYVHWIDVKTTDPQEAYQLIAASLEDKIIRWLE